LENHAFVSLLGVASHVHYLIGLTFRTYTLYPRKMSKNRTFKSLIHKGSELILRMEGKVSKGYESNKRCGADWGSAAVRGYELGIKRHYSETAQTENVAFEL
jgi:hypothetical protein